MNILVIGGNGQLGKEIVSVGNIGEKKCITLRVADEINQNLIHVFCLDLVFSSVCFIHRY